MLEAPTMYRDGDPADETFDRLRAAFRSFLRMTPECAFEGEIAPETPLRDIGDSLQLVSFAMEIEHEFGVQIDDQEMEEFETVADVARFLDSEINP